MDALLEEVQLWLAHSELPLHFEHALTSIVKWFEADWLKLQILRVAAQQVECFWFRFFRVSLIHRWRCSFLFVIDDLAAALVKVHVEEDHLLNHVRLHTHSYSTYLDVGHVEDAFQVEIDFMAPAEQTNYN